MAQLARKERRQASAKLLSVRAQPGPASSLPDHELPETEELYHFVDSQIVNQNRREVILPRLSPCLGTEVIADEDSWTVGTLTVGVPLIDLSYNREDMSTRQKTLLRVQA